jgi:stage II sporulation protein D
MRKDILLVLLSAISLPLIASEHQPWLAVNRTSAAGSAYALPSTIRVGLSHTRSPFEIGCTGNFHAQPAVGGIPVPLNKPVRLKPQKIGFLWEGKKKGVWIFSPDNANDLMSFNGRLYRGKLIVNPVGGEVHVIDELPLNLYLYGVLPREAESGWAPDALKAQAVVSRTFVAANMGGHEANGYDVSNDVFSQVYGGYEDETPADNEAVDATAGEILVDDSGHPIQAFFHSSCGGRTENPKDVWNLKTDLPYLTVVKDKYCTGDPHYRWKTGISAAALQKKLDHAGFHIAGIKKIKIKRKTESGRAAIFTVSSGDNSISVPGNRFRLIVGADSMRSTLITDISHSHGVFTFEGRGWGHGVGFCQWGAQGRALAGQNYRKILEIYFPHTQMVKGKE